MIMIHFEVNNKRKVLSLLKILKSYSLKTISLLGLSLSLILSACSDQQQAGGTASEGENYVYGTLLDTSGQALSQARVYLKQVSIFQDTVVDQILDSTLTNSQGYYNFYPTIEDTVQFIIQSGQLDGDFEIVSRVMWKGPKGSGEEVPQARLGPPVKVRGSFIGLDQCGDQIPELIIPGTPVKVLIQPDGRWSLPPIPGGRSEMVLICGDAVQYIPLDLPPGCQELVLDEIPIATSNEIEEQPFKPYPTDYQFSGLLAKPPAPDQTLCPGGESGPGLIPPEHIRH